MVIELSNKVSLWYHTLHSNAEAALFAASAALAIVLAKLLAEKIVGSQPLRYQDYYSTACSVCMVLMELIFAITHKFNKEYMRRHALLQWPVHVLVQNLLSNFMFDWTPGKWTPFLVTFSYFISLNSTYPLDHRTLNSSFLSCVKSSFAISLTHLTVVGVISLHIILTLFLSDASNASPITILVVTGLVFPFGAFLCRKLLLSAVSSYLIDKLRSGKLPASDYLSTYLDLVRVSSLSIQLTPTVLL